MIPLTPSWPGCLLVLLLVLALPASCATADETRVVVPEPRQGPLMNPGKGWISYHQDPAVLSAKERLYASIGYTRFEWGGIQPDAENAYDWSAIDTFLKAWHASDRQAAFGVMSGNTHAKRTYVTPKWVFDAGAASTTVVIKPGDTATGNPGSHLLPDFLDAVYLQKLDRFVAALAQRYDGDPRIAFIDIRSFRNWGEGYHQTHVLLYARHFRTTRLCQSCDGGEGPQHADFCASRGIAVRRDGIGGSDGHELVPARGRVPAVYEFWGPLDYLEQRGWWRGGTMLTEAVEVGRPTYVEIIRGSPDFLRLHEDLVARLTNRIGYHFVLRQARIPLRIAASQPFPIALSWLNQGGAPIFVPCRTALALIAADGAVAASCLVEGSEPSRWMPDTPVAEDGSACFGHAAPGSYRLAIGLVANAQALNPVYALGITTPMAGKWHVLGDIELR